MRSFKYIISLAVMATVFFACTDDYERSAGGDISAINPVLNMLSQNEFSIEKPADTGEGEFLFRVSWAAPRISYENGLPAEVTNLKYKLEAGILSDSFEKAVTLAETDKLFEDIYSGKLYRVAEELAGEEFEGTVNLEFRVLATYDGVTEKLASNSITVVVLQKETVDPVELTIRFKQTAGDWEEFAVYAWGDSEVYGGWPGQTLEAGADGWYSFTVPVNRPINLILNNNGSGQQMDFLGDPVSNACYELNSTEGTWTEVDCPAETAEELTIRFTQTAGNWEEFAVYAWGESEVYGGWPGLKLDADDNGWYSFTVPVNRPLNLIINDNGAGSQFDFMSDPVSSACYEFDTGNSSWTAVDCPSFPITIRWKYVGDDWTTTAVYAWGGDPTGEPFGSWPGAIGTPDANGWCSVTVPAGQTAGNIIFNNGTGGDGGQFDLNRTVTESTCFEITSGSFTVVHCE